MCFELEQKNSFSISPEVKTVLFGVHSKSNCCKNLITWNDLDVGSSTYSTYTHAHFEWLEYLFECESYFFFVFIHWNSPNNVSIEKFDAINVTRDFFGKWSIEFSLKIYAIFSRYYSLCISVERKTRQKKMMPN